MVTSGADAVTGLLESAGAQDYLGEPVTVMEHLLQAAVLAEAAGAAPALVAAALLHDVGHLLCPGGTHQPPGPPASTGAARRIRLRRPGPSAPLPGPRAARRMREASAAQDRPEVPSPRETAAISTRSGPRTGWRAGSGRR